MTIKAAELSVKKKKNPTILEGANRSSSPEACRVKI